MSVPDPLPFWKAGVGHLINFLPTLKAGHTDRFDIGVAARFVQNSTLILNSGSGTSGPFYVHEQAARAWAFSTALTVPEHKIRELQTVPYACVRRFTPEVVSHPVV